MSSVIEALRASLSSGDRNEGWCVAFSGGLDSTVLLHGLAELRTEFAGLRLRAVHVDHSLHADSGTWAAHCESFAARLSVPLTLRCVQVDRTGADGMEAAARRARYDEFRSLLEPGETLATAHHAEDQVETVLLRLMRGAGPRGLGSIGSLGAFGAGRLARPLLSLGRADLEVYAQAAGLDWIDDPTNVDTSIDRNFLRHEILPPLRDRWPGLDAAIGRAARLAAEAAGLLDELGRLDAKAAVADGLISLDALRALDSARQRNLVRHVLHARGLVPPSEAQLGAGLGQLLSARHDRNPVLRWPGGQIRRYRDRLYVLDADPERAAEDCPDEYRWDGFEALDLGPVRGRLRLVYDDPASAGTPDLVVRFRRGGERMLEADHRHHKQLKKMFQSGGILPWMRAHVPLVTGDGELLAVGDLWTSAEFAARVGAPARLVWDRHAGIR